MENTAVSMYKYFLAIIRKERTTTIPPPKWNEWMNAVLIDWVKLKLPENEFMQKRLDDLEAIKVITDNNPTPYISPLSGYDNNIFPIPYKTDTTSKDFAEYMWGVSAQFVSDDGVSYGKVYRGDTRGPIKNNPFRQTDSDFVYFETRSGLIVVKNVGTFVPYDKLILEYYKYPYKILYDPDDEGNSTAGSFQLTQNQEVVELAARKYLERITDPRYQSYTQEQISTPS
jgi:hypothetical protein